MPAAIRKISNTELAAVLRAVRGQVPAAQATTPRARPTHATSVLALALTIAGALSIFPHSDAPHAWLLSPATFGLTQHEEEFRMRNLQNLAVVSSLAISSLAAAQNAVEWRVADGGNGHWYEVNLDYHGWNAARTAALAIGGDLASLETNAEWNWTRTWLPSVLHGYLIGGRQLPKSSSPSDGWKWLTGGDVQREWMLMDDNPCGIYPANVEDDQQDYLHTCCGETAWGDINDRGGCEIPLRSLVEWSADCNNDGIVDYGQILAGDLLDANHNNIPDCCEGGASCSSCPGDVDNSGAVNGVDLAAVLNSWGTSGGKYPGADVNHDGIVNGSDLAEVLNGWGLCH